MIRRARPGRVRGTRGWLASALVLATVACGDPLLEDERNTIEIYRQAEDSVVFVVTDAGPGDFVFDPQGRPGTGSGSGIVWDRDGHIVTNFHVIERGDRYTVMLADGTALPARLVGVAPNKDLAVLAVDPEAGPLHPLELGSSLDLRVGQKVLAIGNPFGLVGGSLSTGVVSALGREIESVAGNRIEDVIQTDASLNPGSSGGPLLDSSGRLIGITTAIASTSGSSAGVGFAVPVETLTRLVPQLVTYGRPRLPELGVRVFADGVAAQLGIEGVIVRDVIPGSPAARARLRGARFDFARRQRVYDVITELDGKPIRSYLDLFDALSDHDPGDVVALRFLRGNRTWEANVKLGEFKDEPRASRRAPER